MKKILFISFILFSACSPKTGPQTNTEITEVEHIIPLPPIIVHDSVSTTATVDEGPFRKEKTSGGIKVVFVKDSSGNYICQALVDSLLQANDSLKFKVPEKTITITLPPKIITQASGFDKALRWIAGLLLILLLAVIKFK